MPEEGRAQRVRRSLGGVLLLVLAAASILVRRSSLAKANAVCHPDLSHLRSGDGREVLLIGTLPLDLDGASAKLVREALAALRPDVVMVEGSWTAGLNAMLLSGRWAVHGAPPPPGSTNWTDIGDASPVELPKPKRRGLLSFGGPHRFPERSIVPVKVGNWAYHLRGSVGGDIAAAVVSAAAAGVPVRFLGPADGGFQGHVQVSLLARQAAGELLEEEQQAGAQMPGAEVDAALRRAESHVRGDSDKWLRDARGETEKLSEHLQHRVPEDVRDQVTERIEARTSGLASRISSTEEAYRRAAVVLSVDQLVSVESKLKEAGFAYISDCA